MTIYDVYYREKGKPNSQLKIISVVGNDRECCKNIALSKIGSGNTIVKMVKIG